MDNSSRQRALFDKLAVALSGLCLLHCLMLPLVVAVVPFLGQFGEDHFHVELLLFVVPISVIALSLGFRQHRRSEVLFMGAIGLIILSLGATIVHASYGNLADRLMTIAGSVILAYTHFRNFRLAKSDLRLVSQ